ncbi:thiamine monophosphate kinase [Corynebacterium aquilae DSM 44791]|uniref:Thiamine-monophosphate kinase n=1 Tax=Corynebacterium aquilae DSM 44791 TaxID=1431546 RepID=A0A1L7CFK8_9CORY|nr:thiamine monophosphate kinase [Corynebacterium aquilae DSM 44791]
MKDAGEHETIAAIGRNAPSSRNGDDAAVLASPAPNSRTVVSTDALVSGRHFNPNWTSAYHLGRKAITQNFADIEAMGARPIAAVAALAAPAHTPLAAIEDLARGMNARLTDYSAELVGGDITQAPTLTIAVTAIGLIGGDKPPLTLNAARPGQKLVAAGNIGHAAAGLALLSKLGPDNIPTHLTHLVRAQLDPQLVPNRGLVARATGATAMTDNSDGLITDLTAIATASNVRIDIHTNAIQPTPELAHAAQICHTDPWEWILSGGEDHTLLATTVHEPPSGFRIIGHVSKQRGHLPVSIDGENPPYNRGWQAFDKPATT